MSEIRIGKKLEILLKDVEFVKPNTSEVSKIETEKWRQFCMFNLYGTTKFSVGIGPAISMDLNVDGFDNALELLASNIANFSEAYKLRCNLMVLPAKGVNTCNFEVHQNLAIRYIEDYLPTHDELVSRWDILINKEI